jgi:ubiquitin
MKRTAPLILGAAALASQVGNAVAALKQTAATPKKKVTTMTKSVTGPEGQADRWGFVKVTLVVRKTTTTIGAKKSVKRKIVKVTVPEYPNHTDRSVYINSQALPYLEQEVLQAQMNPNIDLISGATATSFGFETSLQGAIALAKKV